MDEGFEAITGRPRTRLPQQHVLERSGLFDANGHGALDRLTALARDFLDVSTVFVALCRDRGQVLVSEAGTPLPRRADGAFNSALCHHVVSDGSPVVVPDIAADGRAARTDDAFPQASGAYLGVPVIADGQTIGVLAAVADMPRTWCGKAVERLSDIAAIVADEIETLLAETRWRALFEDMQESFYVAEAIRDGDGRMADFRYLDVNPAFERIPGRAGAVGRTARELIPGIADKLVTEYRNVLEDRQPRRFETLTGGEWYDVGVRSLGDDRFAVTFHSIGERRRQEALAAQAHRRYQMLFDTIDEGFCIIDVLFEDEEAVDYRFVEVNAAFTRQTGLTDVVGRTMGALSPGYERHWFEAFGRVARRGEAQRFRNIAATLGNRWYEAYAFRVEGEAPNRVAVLFHDVTERVAAEDRRHVLNSELAHRLKNTLAIVSSIVTQTLRSTSDIATARQSLAHRIQALSKAHDILLSGQSDAASIEAIVRGVVSVHDEGGRVRLQGPHLPIGPKASLSLSLVVHELATNAGKYGALSVPEGSVEVAWRLTSPEEGLSGLALVFEWREFGGPAVTPPPRKGFGTRLVEMGLGGGDGASVALDYAVTGFSCRIVAPLAELATADETGAE